MTMQILIAVMLVHGLGMSPGWYFLIAAIALAKLFIEILGTLVNDP